MTGSHSGVLTIIKQVPSRCVLMNMSYMFYEFTAFKIFFIKYSKRCEILREATFNSLKQAMHVAITTLEQQ